MIRILILLTILGLAAPAELSAYSFSSPFSRHKQTGLILITEQQDCPLAITDHRITDRGWHELDLEGLLETVRLELHNKSAKDIIACQIQITEFTPFNEQEAKNFYQNIVEVVKAGRKERIEFQRTINTALASFYKIKVVEILYKDGSRWLDKKETSASKV
jgi:hypothetical protein